LTVRAHIDRKALAIEAAEYLKRKHPHSAVVVDTLFWLGQFPARAPLLNRLDRIRGKFNTLLPAEHLQQTKHAFIRTQSSK